MEFGLEVWCTGVEGMCFSRYADQRDAKSAKRVLWGLLALLAPDHLRVFEKHTTTYAT
jgi:predicted ATP-dependent Lon-type protease